MNNCHGSRAEPPVALAPEDRKITPFSIISLKRHYGL